MRTITAALATATTAALLTGAPAQSAPAQSTDLQPPSRPQSVHLFSGRADDQIRVGWLEPARTGSHPIQKYVIRWAGGRLVTPATTDEITVGGLDAGRYVFRVKALSRAGASPWTRSSAVYVR